MEFFQYFPAFLFIDRTFQDLCQIEISSSGIVLFAQYGNIPASGTAVVAGIGKSFPVFYKGGDKGVIVIQSINASSRQNIICNQMQILL